MKKGLVFVLALVMALSFGMASVMAAEEEVFIDYDEVYVPGADQTMPDGTASEDPYFTEGIFDEGFSTYTAPGFITAPKVYISSPSKGKITVEVRVNMNVKCTKVGLKSMALQYWTGSSWERSAYWSGNYASNTSSYRFSQTLSKTSGTRYRLVGTVAAYNDDGSRTSSFTTAYITCK